MRIHPPERFRQILADHRAAGDAFTVAWISALATLQAFSSTTKFWRATYSGLDVMRVEDLRPDERWEDTRRKLRPRTVR